jgi:Leucine-rich repeat (LRR) protein
MEPLDKIPDRESNQIEIPPELTNTSRSRSAGTMAEGFNASGSSVSSGSRPAYPGSGSGDLPTIAQMSISSEPLGQQTATVISPSTRQKSRLFPAVIAGALLLAIGGILGWAIMGNGNKNVAAHGDPNAQNLDGGTSPVVANPALTHGGVTATHPGDDSRNPDESTSPPSTESTSPPSTTDTGDSKDPTESHTPMPPVPAEPAEEPYRELLTWVFDLGGSATIVQGGDDPAPTTVASLDELPRPPYRVTGISLEETNVSAPQLARLIEMADLESLSLRNTGLNDSVMEQLVQFPRLKQLNLQATRLTDAALQSIRSMATLRRVNLSETGISQKGFATLQSQVPNLDIDWDANHWQRILLADVLALGATISAKVASEEMPKTFKKVENLPREDFQVVGVDLSGQPNLGDEHLDKILDLSDLQHVGLGYTAVTTEGLEKLTQLPRLKSIDLARLQIEEPSLSTWRGMHPRVQIVWKPAAPLTLAQWVLMSGGQVSILPAGEDQPRALKRGSNMPRGTFAIHSVGFAGVKEFDPSWLDSLVGLNGLRELDLRDTSFNDANVQGLIPLEGLRRLVLDQTRISGQGLRELARLPLLESLSLNHTPITDQDLASLVPLKTLKELSLAGTTIGDDAVESMVALKPLSVLDLQDTRLTPRGLKQLEAGLGEVCRIEANPEDPVRVAAKWVMAGGGSIELESGHRFQRLSELPPGPLAIRTVSLASVDPRDGVTVASLERCPELEEIDLVPLRANPRTILAALAERPLLTSRLLKLHLARSGIDDRIIGLLSNFTQLQLLDLSSNLRLTDASFKQLADLKALTELNLRNTNISDASLAQIASYSELVNLDLGGTRVSDQQITLLTSLKKLKILDLYGTRVTSEGAEKLKSELKLDRLTVDSPRRRNPSAEGQLPGGPGGVIPPQGIPPGNQPRPGGGFPPPGGAVQPRAF